MQTPAAQPSRLANAAGLVVFILILIPVSIAALQTLGIQAISTPAIAVLSTVLASIPNVLGAAIILALGFIIGRWVASVVESVLPATGIDRAIGAIGELTAKPGSQSPGAGSAPALPKVSPTKILANIVLFAILAFSAVEAARLLRFEAIALILTSVLTLMGKVVVGGAIIALGVLIADMLANLLKRSSGEENRFVASIVRWAAIALSVGMGLKFMGIADVIVVIAFGSILGSAAVAAALAFGLGAREAAGRLADSWVSRGIEKTKPEGARPTPALRLRASTARSSTQARRFQPSDTTIRPTSVPSREAMNTALSGVVRGADTSPTGC